MTPFHPRSMQPPEKNNFLFILPVALIIGTVVGVGLYLLVSATKPKYGPAEVPSFHVGQMVKMKAFGHRGMVIRVSCPRSMDSFHYPCTYTVRFSAIQMKTNTRVFGSDGPIDVAPIAKISGLREYELQAVN